MNSLDFPGILQAADNTSIRLQRRSVWMMRVNLIFGVIGAGLTIYNFEQIEPKITIYAVSLLLLLGALGVTVAIKYYKFEDFWYQARALAESAKTLTWRYITCSENYESFIPTLSVQSRFNQELQTLQQQFPDLIEFIDNNLLQRLSITAEMNRIRQLSWQDRQQIYLTARIVNQIDWYSQKSSFNKRKKALWLRFVIISQILSVCASVFLILWPSTSWNLVGLFTTISAAAIAWLELKQFQLLAQAYSTATSELTYIRSLNGAIMSEVEFSRYVLDSENAISREHTMWLAQRRFK